MCAISHMTGSACLCTHTRGIQRLLAVVSFNELDFSVVSVGCAYICIYIYVYVLRYCSLFAPLLRILTLPPCDCYSLKILTARSNSDRINQFFPPHNVFVNRHSAAISDQVTHIPQAKDLLSKSLIDDIGGKGYCTIPPAILALSSPNMVTFLILNIHFTSAVKNSS